MDGWIESMPEIGKWVLIEGNFFDLVGKVVDDHFWQCTRGSKWPLISQSGKPFRWQELPTNSEVFGR